MRILVTGGAGFVGSHLVRALRARGHVVDVLDVAPPPATASQAERRLHRVGSVCDEPLVEDLVARSERVIHLAGIAEPLRYGLDPLGTLEVNLQGSLNVARTCSACGVPMVFASTSEIYGNNPSLPWGESSGRVLGPVSEVRWCYSTAKAAVEHYLDASRRQADLDYAAFRLFNVYGAGLRGRVVDAFVDRARAGEPLVVHGDGLQTRAFCYVEDAIGAIVAIAEAPTLGGATYNIGNPTPTRIVDLAKLVIELTGSRSPIRFEEHETVYEGFADVRHRVPNVDAVKRAFGWEPRWNLADGLRAMLRASPRRATSSRSMSVSASRRAKRSA